MEEQEKFKEGKESLKCFCCVRKLGVNLKFMIKYSGIDPNIFWFCLVSF